MYRIQYFCPRQGQFWQGNGTARTLQQAIGIAQMLKPPQGLARVIDPYGNVVYQI